jgi:hypothetical protein
MKLRIVSAILWFLAGLVLAGAIAYILGVSQLVGVIVGAAWAAFVTIDPKHLIWGVESRGTPPRMSEPRSAASKAQVGTGS